MYNFLGKVILNIILDKLSSLFSKYLWNICCKWLLRNEQPLTMQFSEKYLDIDTYERGVNVS